jgi:hypothetical protein
LAARFPCFCLRRGRLCCGFWLTACLKPKAAAFNKFIRTVGRFCRYNILKTTRSGKQSLSPTILEKRGQNFARTKILPFLHEGIFVKLHIV